MPTKQRSGTVSHITRNGTKDGYGKRSFSSAVPLPTGDLGKARYFYERRGGGSLPQ